MSLAEVRAGLDAGDAGRELHALVAELYPICRSITGDGVRETLRRIGRRIPLEVQEVQTGTAAFDWTVPREWNIRDAYLEDPSGRRIVSFSDSNLHVMGYSVPVRRRMSLAELRPHLFSSPEHPRWIPYRTSYYSENWGLCLPHVQLEALPEGDYEVCIDSTLVDGHLTYAECVLAGERTDEVLISCHVCHPSLCNDNLSGIAVATLLARAIAAAPHRYTYRFLFIPATIGAITWLSRNEDAVARTRHGLVLTCVGDPGPPTYKRSRRGAADVDRAFEHVLAASGEAHDVTDFSPWGYDERQYCSPGFDLPVGCLMRTPHGRFPEYHSSADDLGLVTPAALADSLVKCLAAFDVLERDGRYLNLNPDCEPQLGKRGLYQAVGGQSNRREREIAMLWVLNLSDGAHTLLDIAVRAELPFDTIAGAASLLREHGLLEELELPAALPDPV